MKYLSFSLLAVIAACVAFTAGADADSPTDLQPRCSKSDVESATVEMCLYPGGVFQHDTYVMRLNGVMVFALADDFVEQVVLTHKVLAGPAIEFPLSRGEREVTISGGCVPESRDGAEAARVCNFRWGRYDVVRELRFSFE